MNRLLLFILFLTVLKAQELFDSFNLDEKHRFSNSAVYDFTVTSHGENIFLIKGIMGDVEIKGDETNNIHIEEEAEIFHKHPKQANAIFVKEKALISQDKLKNIIAIKSPVENDQHIRYQYHITLPSHFSVDIQLFGGNIDIDHISGEINVNTSGGDINLSSISGKVTVSTAGGDIDITESEGNMSVKSSGGDIEISYTDGQIAANTNGGDIHVHFIQGNVDVHTDGGYIQFSNINGQKIKGSTSGGDIDIEDVQGNIEVKTHGGQITAADVDGNLTGSTAGGDIELKSINGNVWVSSNAGDILGQQIAGSIKVNASHGDVEMNKIWKKHLNSHTIELKTADGDIELKIPKFFPATINALISDAWTDNNIDSEIPITISIDEKNKKGYLKQDDGRFAIQLETNHGNIIIQEE